MLIDVMNFSVCHIFSCKQTLKCQRCQLCVLRETLIAVKLITSVEEAEEIAPRPRNKRCSVSLGCNSNLIRILKI